MMGISATWKPAVLAAIAVLAWSALFGATYGYSFYWDDLHLIRAYSWDEVLSAFHGGTDPDGIETMALRPIGTLLFCFQGTIFGENVVLQRAFMAVLMWGLLWVVGLLLREVGLSFRHVAVVLVLFASSRVFASLILWITLGPLILSYIFMTLTALCYLRWLKRERSRYIGLTLGFAALTIFTREEAYTLPVVLPLLWCISSPGWIKWRRAVAGALGVTSVLAVHFMLRTVFVPAAPPIRLSLGSASGVLLSLQSAWMPGGHQVLGYGDRLVSHLWQGFLGALGVAFVSISSSRAVAQLLGVCVLGAILCAPALGIPREFGIAMPTLAFFTAISVAFFRVHQRISPRPDGRQLWRPAVLSLLSLGIALGVGGGVRRSAHVANALHENSAAKVVRDGEFLFDLYKKPASIPAGRREAGLARLAALGIHSREDLRRLQRVVKQNPSPRLLDWETSTALFLEKYDYLSF